MGIVHQKEMSKFAFQFKSNGRNYPATAEHVGDHTIVTYNAGTTKFSGQLTVDQASDAMQHNIMTCSKRNLPDTMRDAGIIGHHNCTRPVFKDGLCKRHYERAVTKKIPWGLRHNYRPATREDLQRMVSLKLASECSNKLYRVINNEVHQYSSKLNSWVVTTIHPIPELFVVKTL